jgi:hypothetical protein
MKAWSRWQDRTNLVLGAWLFVATWLLGFASVSVGAWNAWIVSVVVALAAFSALAGIGGATKGTARRSA